MNWDLSKLYPGFDAPEFKNDIDAYKAQADDAFNTARSMTVSVASLEAMIEKLKNMEVLAVKTNAFAQLMLLLGIVFAG